MSIFDPTDALEGAVPTWRAEYDDPTFRAICEELGMTPARPLPPIEGVVVQVGQDATW